MGSSEISTHLELITEGFRPCRVVWRPKLLKSDFVRRKWHIQNCTKIDDVIWSDEHHFYKQFKIASQSIRRNRFWIWLKLSTCRGNNRLGPSRSWGFPLVCDFAALGFTCSGKQSAACWLRRAIQSRGGFREKLHAKMQRLEADFVCVPYFLSELSNFQSLVWQACALEDKLKQTLHLCKLFLQRNCYSVVFITCMNATDVHRI